MMIDFKYLKIEKEEKKWKTPCNCKKPTQKQSFVTAIKSVIEEK